MARRPREPSWSVDFFTDAEFRGVFNAAADAAARIFTQHIVDECARELTENPVESPIEAVFCAWWLAIKSAKTCVDDPFYGLNLYHQREVMVGDKTYRLDFIVGLDGPEGYIDAEKYGIAVPLICVELDGHDFHERTKEQVAYRNQRDRDLQSHGWTVFHFSGSEVMRDPEHCVLEVMEHASQDLFRFENKIIDARRGTTPHQEFA